MKNKSSETINPIDPEKLTDRELILVLFTRQENLIEQFNNHLHHHEKREEKLTMYTKVALSAALTGAATFVVGVLLILIQFGIVH